MKQWAVFTCIVLLTLQFASARGESDGSCPINTARRNVLKVSYDRRLNNSDGQWTTAFSARTKDASKSTADLKMEATHNVVECGENREIHVEILVKDGHENQTVEKRSIDNGLRFHHRHGPNVVVFNGGLSAQRINGGTWIYYDVNVYGENKVVVPNYGANVCNTKVGETIGVMKRDNGSLHFFVNGIDQGPAISNAPSVVYGVYEVRGFAAIATIINKDG
ncbi:uncharacterized protein LOC124164008 isoform X2 [Ischnura elegans]|uniref:uncharacterized protein LOC124164008 isoform X2 n=1 Tax=Ischnura elegans TaxID=197161 RepID=UPI001ED8B376|nr:uncharacterized protein LOC124164008 isoform X2 [Ischnura elegans]